MTLVPSSEFPFEVAVRITAFLAVLVAMAAAEAVLPRRQRRFPRGRRWPGNAALAALNSVLVRVLLPITAVGAAVAAEHRGFGLLNQIAMPAAVAFAAAVAMLDLTIYLQHVLFHAVPVLWRIHRVHHADLDFDVTTGLRFHPVEIVLSMVIKVGAAGAIGAPPLAVLVFEVLLNATSMFNHGNLAIGERTERWLRWMVVTPDMHRVHHSIFAEETNSNFGFNLPWWDRILGTYRDQPAAGHLAMTIGIEQFRSADELGFLKMLTQPLRAGAGGYPIGAVGAKSAGGRRN